LKATEKIGYRAGTTCLALLLTKDKYIVANVGDSRAVLSRGHKALPLSIDHKPTLLGEKIRIEKAGGFVCKGRVNNSLSMSRCLGDFELKKMSGKPYDKQAVIGIP
jgi:serine/threonine protein phosphatase PrpC